MVNQLSDTYFMQNPGLLPEPKFMSVELRRISTGHHWLTASLHGVVGNFILDTGAGATVLDPNTLARFGIDPSSPQGEKISAGVGGAVKLNRYAVEQFSIQGQALKMTSLYAVDLSAVLPALSQAAGVTLHGIVGQDLLTAHQGILEVAADRLFLHRTALAETPDQPPLSATRLEHLPDYVALPLTKLTSGHDTIPIEINGATGHFVIDSGARLSVVHLAKLPHFGLQAADRLRADSASGGIGGAVTIRQYRVNSFRVAGRDVPQPTLGAFDLSAVVTVIETETGATIDGVIGQDTLIRHRAIIDTAGQRLLLAELPTDPEAVATQP